MPSVRYLETNNPNRLLHRIADEFPEISWNIHKYINHGWDHEVIILDDTLVFRFPNSSEYLPALKDEIRLLDYLSSKIDCHIPRYLYVAGDSSFAGYEIIQGAELTTELFENLSDEDQMTIAKQTAKFLTQLHTIRLDEIERFNVTHADLKAEAEKLRINAKQHLPTSLNAQEYQHVLSVLDEFDAILDSEHPLALIHNDFSPNHILWDMTAKEIGIIDFSDRAISDPAFDFAELFLYGKSFVEDVYSSYQGPKDDMLLARAATYLKRVGVYMLCDSFLTGKMSYEKAKALFDKTAYL